MKIEVEVLTQARDRIIDNASAVKLLNTYAHARLASQSCSQNKILADRAQKVNKFIKPMVKVLGSSGSMLRYPMKLDDSKEGTVANQYELYDYYIKQAKAIK